MQKVSKSHSIPLIVFIFILVEKAAFAALEASDGEYEELEDDFLMIANEGELAVEVIEEEVPATKAKKGILKNAPGQPFDMNEADFRSRDIMILTGGEDEEDEEEKALNEYRLRMAALLPTAGINFTEVPQGQEDLDAGFDAFMDEEYDDYKIGELDEEEVEAQDKIDQKVIDEAVDEFIEDTKTRFLDLTKKHGTDEQRNLLPQYVKASE